MLAQIAPANAPPLAVITYIQANAVAVAPLVMMLLNLIVDHAHLHLAAHALRLAALVQIVAAIHFVAAANALTLTDVQIPALLHANIVKHLEISARGSIDG